jgi:hypothetical protein
VGLKFAGPVRVAISCCVGVGNAAAVFVGINGAGNPIEKDLVGPKTEDCCPAGKKLGIYPVACGVSPC